MLVSLKFVLGKKKGYMHVYTKEIGDKNSKNFGDYVDIFVNYQILKVLVNVEVVALTKNHPAFFHDWLLCSFAGPTYNKEENSSFVRSHLLICMPPF